MTIETGSKLMTSGENSIYLADEKQTELFGRLLAFATRSGLPDMAAKPESHATIGGRIFLAGELGAGKTTLTRGLVKAYGHHGAVKSPTYTLVEPYEFEDANLYHFDLYRLSDPEEVEFLGVEEYLSATNLCIIEWAEKGAGFLPDPDITIEISIEGNGRRVHWQSQSNKGAQICQTLIQYYRQNQLGMS